ncbi:MAG: TatD family deoxyribonuclease [Rhodothermaeota bacterium MED-G64]|nr:MAG: TatD family deoxyribonuclease [Rhodothermaeota bacterium MED-G64]|tara:strand:- start:1334 stop:2119 length:786 start_codon:yes stop_codon:yes gene_type:complete
MIDTHCHLYLDDFKEDLHDIATRASEVGVTQILMPAISMDSVAQMDRCIDTWESFQSGISLYKMAGIHPCEWKPGGTLDRDTLFQRVSAQDICAVGETGLDAYWSTEAMAEQLESLDAHLSMAKELQKPIVLHNRETTTELLDRIEAHQDGSLTGVWHCFTGTENEARRAIDLGLYLGIGGVFTFKKTQTREFITSLPLERLLLETDAPYLAPAPFRGKRNEPSYVAYTAQALADTLECSLSSLVDQTTTNARKLFGLPPS